MVTAAIELQNLTKRFGKITAVKDLTFDVFPGEVLGFLGPNGAGKTTAMRSLVGLLSPTSGTARVLGFDSSRRQPGMLAEIGYLPGALELYENLSGREFLGFLARMRSKDCDTKIRELADRLDVNLDRHIHDLSKGNRQKIGVIAAFMHAPKVLILDEPTSGLDPLVQREFEKILAEARSAGAAVLLSSHVLSEVEHLSQRVAIIHKGSLVLLDDIAELKARAVRRLEFDFDSDIEVSRFGAIAAVQQIKSVGQRVLLDVQGTELEVIRLAAELGATNVRSHEPNLDEIFVGLVDRENEL